MYGIVPLPIASFFWGRQAWPAKNVIGGKITFHDVIDQWRFLPNSCGRTMTYHEWFLWNSILELLKKKCETYISVYSTSSVFCLSLIWFLRNLSESIQFEISIILQRWLEGGSLFSLVISSKESLFTKV